MYDIDYFTRLSILKIQTLELRRLHFDLIMCYKIFNGMVELDFNDFFVLSRATATRGHKLKLNTCHCRVNARLKCFVVRVIDVWNNLPSDIVFSKSLASFRDHLYKIDFSSFNCRLYLERIFDYFYCLAHVNGFMTFCGFWLAYTFSAMNPTQRHR